MKKLLSLILCCFAFIGFAACNDSPSDDGGDSLATATDAELFAGLDFNMSASLDVMVWSGDGKYYQDLGHQDIPVSSMTGQNVAALYAVAKEFNKIFPNVKINLYSKANDPDGGEKTWEQELEDFYAEHQKYPDVWASNSVSRDITKGLVLDLNEFSDTVYYKRMNDSLLSLTNFFGFQGALPQYILPWGVYVNRELAEMNNIKTPDPDWSWAQYTNFVSAADISKGVYGSWDAGMNMIRMATVEAQLQNGISEGYIDIDTTEFKNAIKMLPKQTKTAVNSLYGDGTLTSDDMVEIGNFYGYRAFAEGDLLTYSGDPWMLGTCLVPGTEFTVLSSDWDIYPMPSVTGENFVSAVLDPVCVYNYYKGSENPSDALKTKALLAFSFASFWTTDTRSWQARAEQKYTSGNAQLSSLNDSFPVVTGDLFDEQMEIWYSTDTHAAYADAEKFPGFAYVKELWNDGYVLAASDKAYPLSYYDESGNKVDCLEYLSQYGNPDYVGNVAISDGDVWVNTYLAGVTEWNEKMNTYFGNSFGQIKSALNKYYKYNVE